MTPVPYLPDNAPFSAVQRQWLNGYLAGLLSNAVPLASAGLPSSPEAIRKLLVLYGSQSGNAEGLARDFARKLGAAGFTIRVLGMEECASTDLAAEERLLIVTSTWGDGDPPDNAVEFWNALAGDSHPRLENLSYAVLGLGDTNYLNFCATGRRFDMRLEALGARRLVPCGECDVDFEATAEAWLQTMSDALGADADPAVAADASPAPVYSKANPYPAILRVNRRLNGEGAERDTRHIELSLDGSGLSYEAGDVVGVMPENCPHLVGELLEVLGVTGKEPVPLPDGSEGRLREALLRQYGITAPGRKLLQSVATRAGDLALAATVEDASALASYLWGREVIDVLREYPGARFTPREFVALLGKLNPRLYSISSSPRAHEGEVHLTVARVEYESNGRIRRGVCSSYLSDRVGVGGKVGIYLQAARHFKLPADGTRPIVMVGPGTGIAPFRAFLEERRATGATGNNWLIFGNPHAGTDFLYRDELEAMAGDGTLTRLDLAWSRDQAAKQYVQHRMEEGGAELWQWIDGEQAHFYVCGDAKRMAREVDDALQRVVADHGRMTAEEAAAYVSGMRKRQQYQRDVY